MMGRGLGVVFGCGVVVFSLGAAKPKAGTAQKPMPIAIYGPVTRPATQPVGIPDLASQARAGKFVREIFQKEYAWTIGLARREFARKLMQQGLETNGDAAARFVLFREARDIAAGAGDAGMVARAIELLDRYFIVDEIKMNLVALRAAGEASKTGEEYGAVAQIGVAVVRRAVGRDDYESAEALTAVSSSAANKAENAALQKQVRELGGEVQKLAKEFEGVKAAQQAIAEKGEDAERRLTVGRHLCFVKSDFGAGLAMLAKGADPALRGLANSELGGARDVGQKVKLANGWWDLAVGQTPMVAGNLRKHAVEIYREVLPGLRGLDRSAAEKRVEMYYDELVKERGLKRGLY
ncbi:MAG: hypothetical protein NTU53_02480, partial [Planctomycetota bacterium]|nr:hypothetical protein [Planctomycetota bacterium]